MFAKASAECDLILPDILIKGDIVYIEYLIKKVRNEKGISLRELSKRADVSVGHLSDVENGLKEPSFFIMIRIARALDVELDKIYKLVL